MGIRQRRASGFGAREERERRATGTRVKSGAGTIPFHDEKNHLIHALSIERKLRLEAESKASELQARLDKYQHL